MVFLETEFYLGKKKQLAPMCTMINAPERKNKKGYRVAILGNFWKTKQKKVVKFQQKKVLSFSSFCFFQLRFYPRTPKKQSCQK